MPCFLFSQYTTLGNPWHWPNSEQYFKLVKMFPLNTWLGVPPLRRHRAVLEPQGRVASLCCWLWRGPTSEAATLLGTVGRLFQEITYRQNGKIRRFVPEIILMWNQGWPLWASLWDLGSQARGWARVPVVGAPSPNHWTNREPQTPGNINQSEASRRSSSQREDLALSNYLQTPVLDVSGQTTSKTGIQHHPLKKKKTKKYVTYEGAS